MDFSLKQKDKVEKIHTFSILNNEVAFPAKYYFFTIKMQCVKLCSRNPMHTMYGSMEGSDKTPNI